MASDKTTDILPPNAAQPARPAVTNVIAAGCEFAGNVHFVGDVRMAGEIRGQVSCEGRFIIEPSGRLEGRLYATEISVFGEAIGEIVAQKQLSIANGANVEGSVFAPSMSVEGDRARLEGDIIIAPQRPAAHEARAETLPVIRKLNQPAPTGPQTGQAPAGTGAV